ncbi:MAG: carboxypeptidase-like regulatory domain-containing protein, partial [Lewinellaceae bacterium]|nr:carboxypeptidase-like regulatory domain-containing protein [Lewinellaceae bacterium]
MLRSIIEVKQSNIFKSVHFMKNALAFLFLCWSSIVCAQNAAKFTLSGTITDGTTGETLIGVTIHSANGDGAISNEYGFYSLTLPAGPHTFKFSYLGYVTATYNSTLNQNQKIDITLFENSTMLAAVEIKDRKSDEFISQPVMGVEKINMAEWKSL